MEAKRKIAFIDEFVSSVDELIDESARGSVTIDLVPADRELAKVAYETLYGRCYEMHKRGHWVQFIGSDDDGNGWEIFLDTLD